MSLLELQVAFMLQARALVLLWNIRMLFIIHCTTSDTIMRQAFSNSSKLCQASRNDSESQWLTCVHLGGHRWGMRGRLWLLWSTMTFGGLFTCLIGIAGNSFGMTIACVILAAAGIEVPPLPTSLACCVDTWVMCTVNDA